MNETLQTGARPRFHVLTKPIGPICNLDCRYCFYLEKQKLYPEESQRGKERRVAGGIHPQVYNGTARTEIYFAWQGGEPTLLGVEFFAKVVQLQRKFAGNKTISNALQTNGTLLDDHWC